MLWIIWVAGPDGGMIVQAPGQEEGIVFADIDLEEADRQREDIPYFDDLNPMILQQLSAASEEWKYMRGNILQKGDGGS